MTRQHVAQVVEAFQYGALDVRSSKCGRRFATCHVEFFLQKSLTAHSEWAQKRETSCWQSQPSSTGRVDADSALLSSCQIACSRSLTEITQSVEMNQDLALFCVGSACRRGKMGPWLRRWRSCGCMTTSSARMPWTSHPLVNFFVFNLTNLCFYRANSATRSPLGEAFSLSTLAPPCVACIFPCLPLSPSSTRTIPGRLLHRSVNA